MKVSSLNNSGNNFNYSLIISVVLHLLIFFSLSLFLLNKRTEYFSPEVEIGYAGGSQGSGSEEITFPVKEIAAKQSLTESDSFVKSKVNEDSTLTDIPVTKQIDNPVAAGQGNLAEGNKTGSGTGSGSGNGNGSGNGVGNGSGNGAGNGNGNVFNAEQLPFVPRQILEVIPVSEGESITGIISLTLKIGTDGRVITHKVLLNTTGSDKELQNVIKAAYKSKWEAIKIKDTKIEYWVNKTYRFN